MVRAGAAMNKNSKYAHIYIHSPIHTSIHSHIHTFIHTYIHIYIFIRLELHSLGHTRVNVHPTVLTGQQYDVGDGFNGECCAVAATA